MEDITGSRKSIILFFFLSMSITRGKQRVEAAVYRCKIPLLSKEGERNGRDDP